MPASGYAQLSFGRPPDAHAHRMCPPRRHRLFALFALVALFFATTAYMAHGFDGTPRHENTQCDLCLQFSGTAGAPAEGGLVGKPPLVVFVAVPAALPLLPVRRKVGNRLPRAPPSLGLI
jgi:hypothetical protein